MKKTFIILMVLIVFGMIGGGLYNTVAKLDAVEEEVELDGDEGMDRVEPVQVRDGRGEQEEEYECKRGEPEPNER